MICYERDIPDQPPLWPDNHPTLRFVLKLHHASKLHHDFRLEAHGVLISWALPDILDLGRHGTVWAKQMGDHDLQYMLSERRIPPGQYGAGPMLVRDHGFYRPLHHSEGSHSQTVCDALREGQLDFELFGHCLRGGFRFQRFGLEWRLRKLHDKFATNQVLFPDALSVLTGRSLEEII